jgi:cytochrome c oxidase accessory protein FixG
MARHWVYPASVKGRFQRLHRATGVLLQAFLFVTPWIPVGGRPAVQIDIPARRIFALGNVYTASDAIFLVLALLVSVFGLFLVTALWGRLWCGYACPQTVFLEEWIRPLEKLIEGERGMRMQRAKNPWAFKNLWRFVVKNIAFAAVAGLVAMTTVSWFSGGVALWTGAAGAGAYTMVAVIGAGLFADFAWFREQFCNYLCPYARFQGALSDEGSLAVHYNVQIGEPRKGVATRGAFAASGACVDCKKCVTVCPQGIDIREGFQLECIACARCVDACEGVMGKLGQESLISYTPLQKTSLLRPRTVAYGALLAGLSTALVFNIAMHDGLDASVARAPGTLFVVDSDGWTRNVYFLKVVNTSLKQEDATVKVEGLPSDAQVTIPAVKLDPAATTTVPVVVRVKNPRGPITRYSFTVATHDSIVELPATFAAAGG